LIGGAAVAPAVAKTTTAHAVFAAFAGHDEASLGRREGLPPGLDKRDALPRGLAKKDRLPRNKEANQGKAVPHENHREKDHDPRGLTEEPGTSSSASSSSSGNGSPDNPGKS
jgi:hypothetical protein